MADLTGAADVEAEVDVDVAVVVNVVVEASTTQRDQVN